MNLLNAKSKTFQPIHKNKVNSGISDKITMNNRKKNLKENQVNIFQ